MISCSIGVLAGSPAWSQDVEGNVQGDTAAAAAPAQEIIVTARKRAETLIAAPVSVTVVSGGELDKKGLTKLDDLSQTVPQLVIGDIGSNITGGVVLIRGVGVSESNPFSDQAVSFNVDGVQVGRATIRRVAEIDVAQIEVLKGPQALHFGKNSPAGIISIRTADPGSDFEAGFHTSYEIKADEIRADGYVSGPLTDALGARVMVYGSDMQGYFRNVVTPSEELGPTKRRVPSGHEYGGRVTLVYDDGSDVTARFKLSHGRLRGSGPDDIVQVVACPQGVSQLAPLVDDCSANNTVLHANTPPALAELHPGIASQPYTKLNLTLASLELNYDLSDALTLTSVSGYYKSKQSQSTNFVNADSNAIGILSGSWQAFKVDEFNQELRLESDFDGPLNFLVGAYGQTSQLSQPSSIWANFDQPAQFQGDVRKQKGDAISAFAQLSYDIMPTLEFSAGGRYSYEKKKFSVTTLDGDPKPTATPKRSWNDFSPEVVLTWRPDSDLTVYGGYKKGFLSGGFNAGAGSTALDRSYDQQTSRGFEVGVKSRILDRRLRFSLVGYDYEIRGLQVAASVVNSSTGIPDAILVNAAKVSQRGVEFEADFSATDALSLHTAIAYNRARYKDFDIAPCYSGQSVDFR
ncbi:MAG: TonB-dependent receptor [Caenibius sp.]